MLPDPKDFPWKLDSTLERDTVPVGDLPLSRVLLINDANYPWLLLVPRRQGASEIIDLEYVEQAQLMTEIAAAGRVLKELSDCDKINTAALGNVVPQLHVHVIARKRGDAAWPSPAGGVVGCIETAVRAGIDKVVGFDMGGTSTDVSHFAGDYERTFETEVAGVRMRAPMMLIHTVAAGGGPRAGTRGAWMYREGRWACACTRGTCCGPGPPHSSSTAR